MENHTLRNYQYNFFLLKTIQESNRTTLIVYSIIKDVFKKESVSTLLQRYHQKHTRIPNSVYPLIHYHDLHDLEYKSRASALTCSKSTCSCSLHKTEESQDRGTKPRNYYKPQFMQN